MSSDKNCKQESCQVNKDGKCLEGLELAECPHFYLKDTIDEVPLEDREEKAPIPTVTTKKRGVSLFNGVELNANNTTLITYQYESKSVFILGDSDCGKTTLLATIFDILQKGPLKDIYFAGSYTQIGFESRCHLSRISSKANHAETEKTNSKELNFLHLALKTKKDLELPAKHLLISDISGERLQIARDSSSAMSELTLLKTADKIIVIIDGKKIADKKSRELALFTTSTLIQRAIDELLLVTDTDLKIVVSKWDLLEGDEKFDFANEIENHFLNKFDSFFNKIGFAQIAARPLTSHSKIKTGHGIYELIKEWLYDKEEGRAVLENKSIHERQFLNF